MSSCRPITESYQLMSCVNAVHIVPVSYGCLGLYIQVLIGIWIRQSRSVTMSRRSSSRAMCVACICLKALDRFRFFVLISLLQPFPILIGAEEWSLIHNLSPWSMFCSVNAFNSSKSAIIMMLITCRYAISDVYVGLLYLVATSRGAKVK